MARPEPRGDDTTLAAVAYILTWLTGLIIFLVADDDDTYSRWHALQAIFFGIVVTVIGWILSAVGFAAGFGGGPGAMLGFGLLGGIWGLIVLILIIVLAVKAYQGESVRIPVLAGLADDHA